MQHEVRAAIGRNKLDKAISGQAQGRKAEVGLKRCHGVDVFDVKHEASQRCGIGHSVAFRKMSLRKVDRFGKACNTPMQTIA
ncbi:MAG: hypothetical protein QM667_07385 [Asticcacaulis sp.]